MTNILLVRTGKTDYDLQGRIQGTIDLPLSPQGRRETMEHAARLPQQSVEAVYAGPGLATQQTAELVAARFGQKVKTQKRLHNLNLGLWQGMLIEEVKNKQPRVYRQWLERPETVCPPEGETVKVALERLQEALSKIIKKHKSGTIAIVLPEPLASLMCHLLRECQFGDLWQSRPDDRPAWEMICPPEPLTVSHTNGVAPLRQNLG